jgi:thioester reductase-like protein
MNDPCRTCSEAPLAPGYLKCRWAAESILAQAAERGIPTTIFRGAMTAPARVALDHTDINSRILAGAMITGSIPDFNSAAGGGMSWISADFLAASMLHFAHRSLSNTGEPRISHIISDRHILYNQLPALLGTANSDQPLKSVPAAEWFSQMRAQGDFGMEMQAEVLEKWCEAGWVAFPLEAEETLRELKRVGLVSPRVDEEMLRRLVLGDEAF